jgi:hypothetical protein
VQDGSEDGRRVRKLGLLERQVRCSELSRRDGLKAERSDGEDASRLGVVGVASQRDGERGQGGGGGEVQARRLVDGEEEGLEGGKVDGSDLSIEESHRRLEGSRRDVIRREGRVAHPELLLGDPRGDDTVEVLVHRDGLLLLIPIHLLIALLRCQIPRILRLLCRSAIYRHTILAGPLVHSTSGISVAVLNLSTAAFSVRRSCERTVEEGLSDTDRRPVGFRGGGDDGRGAQSGGLNGGEEGSDVFFVETGGGEDVLGELDESIALGSEVRKGVYVERQ